MEDTTWIIRTLELLGGIAALLFGAVCIAQFPHILAGTSYYPKAKRRYAPVVFLSGALFVILGAVAAVSALK